MSPRREREAQNTSLVEELDAAGAQAEALGQPNVRVSAAGLKARLAGLDAKKLEVGGPSDFSRCESEEDVITMILQDDPHETLAALDKLRKAILDRLGDRAKVINPGITERTNRRPARHKILILNDK